MIELLAFYVASGFLLLSSLFVVISRDAIRSALFLILAFFSASSLWVLLQAEFLAILLLLVYVGAVMVLFIYVIMITSNRHSSFKKKISFQSTLVWLVGGAILVELVLVLAKSYFTQRSQFDFVDFPADYSNTEQLGTLLFTDYLYPFELAGILLLLAIVVAIVLMHKKPTSKFQDPAKQVQVKKEDRLKILKVQNSALETEKQTQMEEKQ